MANVRSRPWARITWNNGAPTVAEGDGMSAPGNPATGRIQLNFPSSLVGNIHVVGNAGASAWQVVVINTTGLIEVQDNSGAAVNFNVTSGNVFVQTRVTESIP